MPPPTRAKRAMDEAPIPNPAAAERFEPSSPAPSQNATSEIPRSPRPPTERPITAPPLYETAKAPARPSVLAAMVVLPFAEVAARIPQNPAMTEARAPPKKAMDVSILFKKARSAPTTTTKRERTLYSAQRNAIAPS